MTLFIIRLLSPADYGILGMTTYFIALAAVVSEFGLGSAVMALPELPASLARQLNTLALWAGLAALLLSAAAALPLSWYFRQPVLVPIVIVMGVSLLIDVLRTVPVAMLGRELQYRKTSSVDFVRSVCSSVVVLALALLGAGYWSLVGGILAGSAGATLWALRLRPLAYERPQWAVVKPPLVSSSHLLVGRLAWQGYENVDFLIAGRMFGAAQLGFYNVGWMIAVLPREKLVTILTAATYPFFASLRKNLATLRRYFFRLTYLLCLLLWPLFFGFVLVADLLIPAVLGPAWIPSVPVARALVFYAALQSPVTLSSQILVITGRTRVQMTIALASLAVLPVSFYFSGRQWGITGIAWTWTVLFPLLNVWNVRVSLRELGGTWREYLLVFARVGGLILGMAAVVVPVRLLLHGRVRVRLELGLAVGVGALAYTLMVWQFSRSDLRMLVQAARNWRSGLSKAFSE